MVVEVLIGGRRKSSKTEKLDLRNAASAAYTVHVAPKSLRSIARMVINYH